MCCGDQLKPQLKVAVGTKRNLGHCCVTRLLGRWGGLRIDCVARGPKVVASLTFGATVLNGQFA